MELCNMRAQLHFSFTDEKSSLFYIHKNIPTIFKNYHHVFIKRTGSFFGMETGRETDTF